MVKIERLKREARSAAEYRGHRLGAFVGDKRRATASCLHCGKQVAVTTHPAPNDIDVGGEAVALNCRGLSSRHGLFDNPPVVLAGNPNVRGLKEHVSDYASAARFLGGKDYKRLANNTSIFKEDDGDIAVRLHHTIIVRYKPDGAVIVNSGGWQTVMTKQRINELIFGAGYRIDQVRHQWQVRDLWGQERTIPFVDGMVLKRGDGVRVNPPQRTGPLSRGEIMSNRVYQVRYKHADDGKDYKHDFGAGVRMEALPDGSIRLYHDTLRLWGDF